MNSLDSAIMTISSIESYMDTVILAVILIILVLRKFKKAIIIKFLKSF